MNISGDVEQRANGAAETPNDSEEPFVLSRPPAWKRYLVAIACISIAFAIRYFLTPVLGEEMPFMLFIAASLVASWYGGAASGILVLLLGLFLADYVFLSKGRIGISHAAEIFYFLRYLFTSLLGVVLIEILHRGRRKLQSEIARRKRSERALLEAQRELREHAQLLEQRVEDRTARLSETIQHLQSLLYQIAHSLRAPVRAIGGFLSILLDDQSVKLDDQARHYCQGAVTASARMDAMIHDLLNYGRLGHMEVSLANVSLDEALEKALAHLTFEIQTRKADVELKGPFPRVRANAELLEQVLVNLLENALRFVRPGTTPHIHISSVQYSGHARLWIQDQGIGIDPRYHELIFGPFEVLHPNKNNPGTGMGLAIVKQGMQRMGGRVGVESQLDEGSRFWLELPLALIHSPRNPGLNFLLEQSGRS